ncbi:40S ribosomal protein S19 [Plasmodiophora brassicae]|nr:hypothetical protein PBRA_005149 [Plasmodiophora brassicae]
MAVGKLVKDVPADKFVQALAEHFKKSDKIKVPSWAEYCKTAAYKELPPQNADWYYLRAAAIARRVYLRGGSVGGLQKVYGGADRRGVRRNKFALAAKGIIRNILQQLESCEIVQKDETKKGRRVTSKGRRELDTIASKIEVASQPGIAM